MTMIESLCHALCITIWVFSTTVFGIFNPYVDIYAKPQFHIIVPQIQSDRSMEGYISSTEADVLRSAAMSYNHPFDIQEMKFHGDDYICILPVLEPEEANENDESIALEKKRDELVRQEAKSKALQLLEPLKEKCLYYVEGYFMYSLCYGNEITQFHPAQVQSNPEVPIPEEGTDQYILGRFNKADQDQKADVVKERFDVTVQSSDAGTKYLSQRLGGGTICDLTGFERNIEIQYYCNHKVPNDMIAWIKEVKTCSYEVLVYSPRLCTEMAFATPKEHDVHSIMCRLVVSDQDLNEIKYLFEQEKLQLPSNTATSDTDGSSLSEDENGTDIQDAGGTEDNNIQSQEEIYYKSNQEMDEVEIISENHNSEVFIQSDSINYITNNNEDKGNEVQQDKNFDTPSTKVDESRDREPTDKNLIDYHIVYHGSTIEMEIPHTGNVVDDLRKALNVLLEDVLDQIENGLFEISGQIITMNHDFMILVTLVDHSGQLFAYAVLSLDDDYLRLEMVSNEDAEYYRRQEFVRPHDNQGQTQQQQEHKDEEQSLKHPQKLDHDEDQGLE